MSAGCQQEVSHIAETALRLFKMGSSLTRECDGDAEALCGVSSGAAYTHPGTVGQCLMRQAGNVTAMCWAVLAVALRDDTVKVRERERERERERSTSGSHRRLWKGPTPSNQPPPMCDQCSGHRCHAYFGWVSSASDNVC